MKIKNSFLLIFILFLSSCAYRSVFVIENNTQKEIIIEIFYDSLNIPEIIAKDFIDKLPNINFYNNWDDPAYDKVKVRILNTKDSTFFTNYLLDSLSFYSLNIDEFNMQNLNIVDFNDLYILDSSWREKIIEYYDRDTSIINDILKGNKISFKLPANFSFYKQCSSCGDCSCGIRWPFTSSVQKVKIIIDENKTIILTPDNFDSIMKRKKYEGQQGSYVLEIN